MTRKAPIVLTVTAAGLAGILSFHVRKPASSSLVAPPTTGPSTTSPTTAPKSSSPTHSQTSAPTTAPTTTVPSGTRSASGPAVQYGYGQLGVRVTVSGKKITDVSLVSLATAESYSQQLAQQAIPQLRQEVLSAQSANVQMISGATYTSEAYLHSVQSALNTLKV